MRFVTTPHLTVNTVAVGPRGARILGSDEKLAFDEVGYAGQITWNTVLIEDFDLELGKKHDSITIDTFTLYGVIPIQTKNSITECVYDYAIIEAPQNV